MSTESPQDTGANDVALPALVRPAWMIGAAECDWPEDSSHENGNYYNKCICCTCDFIGHKRRHICRRCHMEDKARYEAMSPEEQMEHHRNRDAAIAEYLLAND